MTPNKPRLYVLVELPSTEPVNFVGVYVLKWGKATQPTVAFREASPREIQAVFDAQNQEMVEELDPDSDLHWR